MESHTNAAWPGAAVALLLGALSLSRWSSAASQETAEACTGSIRLVRYEEQCRQPLYSVDLYSDGAIVFLANDSIDVQRATSDLHAYDELRDALVTAGFLGMNGVYAIPSRDLGSVAITINDGGQHHTVVCYGDGNQEQWRLILPKSEFDKVDWKNHDLINSLAGQIDLAAGTKRWLR